MCVGAPDGDILPAPEELKLKVVGGTCIESNAKRSTGLEVKAGNKKAVASLERRDGYPTTKTSSEEWRHFEALCQ